MRILIAEDDGPLASFVRKGLEAEHYAVDVSADGEQARSMAAEFDYDLVVLDLNLPHLDGISILRSVRTRKSTMPMLVLTARSKVEDRVQCLDMGADDYLVKPFSFSELSARIRALLRRSHLPAESVLEVEDLKLDRVERLVERAGRRIELTSKEFALLEYLMRNAGRRVTRAMIIEHVWNLSFDTCTNVVDVYVNYSTAQVDQRKVGKLAMAIQVAFQELGVFPASTTQIPVDTKEPMPFNSVQAIENAKRAAALARTVPPPRGVLSGGEENGDLSALRRELEQALAPEITRQEVALRMEPDGLVISLREVGFFDSGSADIKANSLTAFTRMANLLAQNEYRIRIEGHTDNVPIHNQRFADNWELSTARATEMIRLLITKYNFPAERLSAAGYAEFHPVADNRTDTGRAQNRRLDIVILGKQPQRFAATPAPAPPASPGSAQPAIPEVSQH
jgi:DNA-binding response OmpR family regulator/outer membrane protein OmpA-like peptidoglycan-associated protein